MKVFGADLSRCVEVMPTICKNKSSRNVDLAGTDPKNPMIDGG